MKKHIAHLHRAKHVLRRAWGVRKRIKLLFLFGFLLYLSILSQLFAAWFVYPNTTMAGIDISRFSAKDIEKLVEKFSALPYRIRIQNREYTYTYPKLGVELDKKLIHEAVFSRNTKPFPKNAYELVRAFFTPTSIPVPLVFTQNFSYFIDQTVFDLSQSQDTMYFDTQDKSLVYIENEERYKIDEQYIKDLLHQRLGDNAMPLYPKLIKLKNMRAENAIDASTRIKNVYLSPLTVIVEASAHTQSFILTENELVPLSKITLSSDQTNIAIDVNEQTLTTIINEHIKKLKFITKGNIVTPKVIEDMQEVLRARFAGRLVDALTISLDNGPNTTGSLAVKYIEVDISQQKMYIFKDNKLVKTYAVSTGLEYPTPTGEFTILNKTGLGYSTIYNVWMAWWMGFKYSDELHAFFGIHELPYTLSGEDKIHRPANFIGTPNTGGCVALGVGDAQEVYRFANIGTKVVIYN